MLKNYIKIAFRNLFKNKVYSFINIFGLAVGIACCLFVFIYVQDELSYDQFHKNYDNLYRLNKVVTPQEGGEEYHAITSGMMGPTLVEDFPEVKQTVRFLSWFDEVLMKRDETSIMIDKVAFTGDNFFEVFDFELLSGNPVTLLEAPFSIVLTETTAHRIFGDENPVGQTITALNDFDYTVTGIAKDPPIRSHLDFSALISWSTTIPGDGGLEFLWMNNWLTQVHMTYLLLEDRADANALEEKFPAFMERHFPERSEQYQLFLQPLNDIYLGSTNLLHVRGTRTGSYMNIYIFSIIAVLILLIACINFINLSTARASERLQEVGVRKALGADSKQLIFQFFGESFLLVVISVMLAIVMVELLLPEFNSFTDKTLHLNLLRNNVLLLVLAGLTVSASLLAGFYPAFVLSRFKPEQALRQIHSLFAGGTSLRKSLVVVQFATTITLFIGIGVVYQQMQFTQTKDLGFNEEQLLTLEIDNTNIADNFDAFKQELLGHSAILSVTGASQIPGFGTIGFTILPEGKPENETWTANVMRLDDFDLINTFEMEIIKGRFFDENRPTDVQSGIVINETLANLLGWDNPVGKQMDIQGELQGGQVIGVVSDFHYESLHQDVAPLVMHISPRHTLLTLRISTSDISSLLTFLEERWEAHESNYPFNYTFFDERWASLYQSEQRFMQTLTLFSALAILIACFGLYGLASFMAQKRTKEIGIRKVLGATIAGIVTMLSKDFLKLVLISFVIAIPVSWYVMNQWLADFAYRIEIGVGFFVTAGGAAIVIALLTVSWQSVRAALANPVESLRNE